MPQGAWTKKLSVYNRAGTRLGNFTAQSAIKFNSVAMTGDGSLIVVVDGSAVYGFSRSSFLQEEAPEETITGPLPGTTGETTTTLLPAATTRKVTTRIPTLPTPYPTASEPTEAALPLAVPLAALLLLFLCLRKT